MKTVFKTIATIVALSAVSMSLQAAFSTDGNNDVQLRKQPPSTSEVFIEQVRISSRMQAAEAAYNLSILAANRKDLTLSSTLIEESIQLDQSNPNYLTFAADIAFLTQQYDKAKTYQLKVLEIARSAPEFDDLQVAIILDQIGAIYVKQEDYEKAESSLQESLHLRQDILGEEHLLVAMSLNKLASLAAHQKRTTIAESLLKKSLDITRKLSGPRHANSAAMLANLADFYQSEKRLEEAEALYEEAISIWADSPVDPLRQAIGQNSLGRLFLNQRRYDEARLQFEQVLFMLKKNYAQDHPYVQQAIRNLTELDAEREKNIENDRMYDELLRELSSRLPKNKGVTADNTSPLSEQHIMHF